jgi:protein O-mannosyl-transferase
MRLLGLRKMLPIFPSLRTGLRWLARVSGFALIGFAVYAPALGGPFFSDDWETILQNPYIRDLTRENLYAILDPNGAPAFLNANYAPVHLLLHGVEWPLFGQHSRGYHAVNLALHVAASTLLVALLLSSRVRPAFAVFGGLLFLVHPANVEGVAWIFELKTPASLVLSLGAILLFSRRPAAATVLFGLGLLTKATAIFALGFVAARAIIRRDSTATRWIGLWCAMLFCFALVQMPVFSTISEAGPAGGAGLAARVANMAATGARYVPMALAGIGLSAFQEPEPVTSLFDPPALAGLAVGLLLTGRTLWAMWNRREDGAYWASVLVSFAPVSQLLPFPYPIADRYLYFMLPGILGGILLLPRAIRFPAAGPRARAAILAPLAALALGFAFESHSRALLWSDPERLNAEAARNFPNGRLAKLSAARAAVARGDADAAVAALQAALGRGGLHFLQLAADPALGPLRGDERFRRMQSDLAGEAIRRLESQRRPNAFQMRTIAIAHRLRGEDAAAIAALEEAVRLDGPLEPVVRSELLRLRAQTRVEP